jgi:hypothetical protein
MHYIFQAILLQSAVSHVTALTVGVIAREVFAGLRDFIKMTLLTNLCLNYNSRHGCVCSCSYGTRSCADFSGLVENASDKRRWAAYTETGCTPRWISVRLPYSWPFCSRRCLHVRKRLSRVAESDCQRVCLMCSSNNNIKSNSMEQSRSWDVSAWATQ